MKTILIASLLALVCGGTLHAQASDSQSGTPADSLRDPLAGKVMNVLGDSYVANHRRPAAETWHSLVAAHHAMTYNNYGRNGGCVAFDRTRDGFGPSLLERYRLMDPTADLVVIIAGHNDAGFVRHSADTLRQFTAAVATLIDSVRVQCPHARVAWVTPWWVDREGFAAVIRAIKHVCKQKHVPVLDNYSARCPVRVREADFRRRYFQSPDDTAHLNAAGHRLFLPTGDAFIRRVMK